MPTKPIRGTQLNKTHPLAKGMVACWLMNEGTGDKVFDLSGNQHHGTLTNMDPTTDWVAGKDGWGLDFNGANDRVILSNNMLRHFVDDKLSLSLWMLARDLSSVGQLLMAGANSNASPGYRLYFIDATTIGFIVGNGTIRDSAYFPLSSPLIINTWNHIAVTADLALEKKLYLNGVLTNTLSLSLGGSLKAATTTAHSFGGWASDTEIFNGKVCSMYMHNRVLAASEVNQLYLNQYQMFED